jgi:integrase/recombinase XerC
MKEQLTPYNQAKVTSAIHSQDDSISSWANLYYQTVVAGSAPLTEKAKKSDLSKFLSFFAQHVGNASVDSWTPSVSRYFQKELREKQYKPTTINRIFASIRHFAKWLHKQRPLLAGFPLTGVKDVGEDDPDWNGLSSKQIMRLKSACEQRMASCNRANQNPLLETTIFHILLLTGIRAGELVSLNVKDYHTRGLHDVQRKGNRVTSKVPLPSEAKEYLDRYLEARTPPSTILDENSPLLVSKENTRFTTRVIRRICERISKQASALLPEEEKFHLSPHMLRHTFLKRIADKHGVHIAQKLSGNISMSEIFNYTKPSQLEIETLVENIEL